MEATAGNSVKSPTLAAWGPASAGMGDMCNLGRASRVVPAVTPARSAALCSLMQRRDEAGRRRRVQGSRGSKLETFRSVLHVPHAGRVTNVGAGV